ncbi:protein Sds24p [Trichomonascus vanleenenianus]|uniref:CBS domain-containing protein n=1 Tax=Trichomonascus vanleenenianus TaxID=2268995 RepID=UPI003EC9FB56
MLSTPPPLSQRTRRFSSASDDSVEADWHDIPLTDIVQKEKLVFVDSEASVEEAFDMLEARGFTSLPIKYRGGEKDEPQPSAAAPPTAATAPRQVEALRIMGIGSVDLHGIGHTFDYADLNAYLLLVLGHLEPVEQSQEVQRQVAKARSGEPVPVKFVSELGIKDPFVTVPSSATVATACEILGNGVHRLTVTDEGDPRELVGILSQRRLIRFIWENGRLFKDLEGLFQTPLDELSIGSSNVITIGEDEPVIDALRKMHLEQVSSVAVIDKDNCLLGNISVVDVRLVTKASQSPYLRYTCKQFMTVILSNRGLINGKDSFPVFHVFPDSTLGRTIAKLVATKAHRLWIVQPSSDSGISNGQLIGVVSLTDILSLFARKAGRLDLDPASARQHRRRSSTSSAVIAQDVRRARSDSRGSSSFLR